MDMNARELLESAVDGALSQLRMGLDSILMILFYKNGVESHVHYDERRKIADAVFSYVYDEVGGFGRFDDEDGVKDLVNSVRAQLGFAPLY